MIDATSCVATALVTSFAYQPPDPESGGRRSVSRERVGDVRVHPAFKVLLDERGNIIASEADLAVIVLPGLPGDDVPAVELADTDTKLGEPLVMVSYGYNDVVNLGRGYRRFRENRITRAPGTGGRVVFDPRGRRTYKGDSGGACLRQTQHGAVLAGILTGPLGEEASFTSTFTYRAWVGAEIQRVAGAASRDGR